MVYLKQKYDFPVDSCDAQVYIARYLAYISDYQQQQQLLSLACNTAGPSFRTPHSAQ